MNITPQQTLTGFVGSLSCLHTCNRTEPLAVSAHLLPSFFSLPTNSEDNCIIPALSLQSSLSDKSTLTTKSCSKQTAAHRLKQPLKLGEIRITSTPIMLLRNISSSFQSVLDKTLQCTIQALTNHAVKTRQSSTNGVMSLSDLAGSSNKESPPSLTSALISFYPLPPSKNRAYDEENERRKMVLPVLFEAVFEVMIIGSQKVTVNVRAPCTVEGSFANSSNLLDNVEIIFDTSILLECMLTQSRAVVRKAMSLVTVYEPTNKLSDSMKDCNHNGYNIKSSKKSRPRDSDESSSNAECDDSRSKRGRIHSLTGINDSLALVISGMLSLQ